MLYKQVEDHIKRLDDAGLIEYVLTGQRMYEEDAVAFAKQELKRRDLSPERIVAVKEPLIAELLHADAVAPLPADRNGKVIVCPTCGLEAPTRFVSYGQNIGMFVARNSRRYEAHLCKRCNHRLFRRTTLITFFLGWWGTISFFVALSFLIGNVVEFLRTIRMPPVPSDAKAPSCDEGVIARVAPFISLITDRLVERVSADDAAREIAPAAGVTPGQAWYYIQLVRASRLRQAGETAAQRPTYGFPVSLAGGHSPSPEHPNAVAGE